MPVAIVFTCDVCGARPDRYACGHHRGELEAELRELYGTVGSRPWAMGPHPWAGRRGTDRARALARGLRQTYGR